MRACVCNVSQTCRLKRAPSFRIGTSEPAVAACWLAMPPESEERVFRPEPRTPGPRDSSWRNITFRQTQCIDGGYQTKTHTVEDIKIDHHGRALTFVKVDKSAQWLIKVAVGCTAQKGALKRSRVLEQLREKLSSTEASAARAAVDDPMDGLDGSTGSEPKNKKYKSKRCSGCVQVIEMPARCHLVSPPTTDTVAVRILGLSTTQLWVAIGDIPWLVAYIAEEVALGGVAIDADDDDDSAVAEPNCSVPGLYIGWSFTHGDAWEAKFVEGPLKGAMFVSSVAKMDAKKWNALIEKWNALSGSLGECSCFEETTYEVRKRATWQWLEHHCGGVFEVEMAAAAARDVGGDV